MTHQKQGGGKRPFQPRKKIRLQGYDYRTAGAYFVTICTHQRACTLGSVMNGRARLSEWGQVVVARWRAIPEHFDYVQLDQFMCMPNHVHLLLWILNDDAIIDDDRSVGSRHASTLQQRASTLQQNPSGSGVKSRSLGAIIGSFKSAVTRQINLSRPDPYPPVWQSRFYDRIVRNERELNAIRTYIHNNPANWTADREWNEGLDESLNGV